MEKIRKQALISFVSRNREAFRFTDEEWVRLLNCYTHHVDPADCAGLLQIRQLDASLLYIRMSQAVTDYAIKSMRPHRI